MNLAVRRGFLGPAAIGVGVLLLLLSAWTVGAAEWAEQHPAPQAEGPHEVLPDRFDALVPPGGLSDATPPGPAVAEAAAAPNAPPEAPVATAAPAVPTPGPYHPPRTAAEAASAAPTPDIYHPPRDGERALAAPPRLSDDARDGAIEPDPARGQPPVPIALPTSGRRPVGEASRARERGYGPPEWMAIPRLQLSSAVSEVGVEHGEYDVPLWTVGHHADSSEPGAPGNSIYNGHVETLHAGRVFAHLKDLAPGDAVYVYTPTYRLAWRVDSVESVPNDDTRFLQPTPDRRITLYTCTGHWDPLARDYTERLVVVARLVGVSPRA